MKVVHLEAGDENYIEIGDKRYLVLRDENRGCHTVSATCPHRGGPLHLGEVDGTGRFIVCPWHKTKVNITRLLANGLPTIRSRERVTVLIEDDTEETAYSYRRMSFVDCEAALAHVGGAE